MMRTGKPPTHSALAERVRHLVGGGAFPEDKMADLFVALASDHDFLEGFLSRLNSELDAVKAFVELDAGPRNTENKETDLWH